MFVGVVGCVWSSVAPPTPAPGVCPPYTVYPGPGCNCAYEKSKCLSLKDSSGGCQWCSSSNGHHNLCFAASSTAKLDKSKWDCGDRAEISPVGNSPILETSSTNTTNSSHWAVIVAGSKVYSNYRHQADACHAYRIVQRNGIPKSNIILM